MSTEKNGKKKRRGLTVERVRIIEYVCIGLVVLLFTVLAIRYGTKDVPEAEKNGEPTPDTLIRGEHVWDALYRGGFTDAQDGSGFLLTAPSGTVFRLSMKNDADGILELTIETELCADPGDDSETSERLREKNRQTLDSLRSLFDRILPVFHRTVADSDMIVRQCGNVVSGGEPYSKKLGEYTVRITSDPDAARQTVVVTLTRNS